MSFRLPSVSGKLETADSRKSKAEPAEPRVEAVAADDTTNTKSGATVKEDVEKKTLRQLIPAANSVNPFKEQTINPLAAGTPYSVRKNAAQAMMDGSLLFANLSQIRTLASSEKIENQELLLAMVIISIGFQAIFAALIVIIWHRESHRKHKQDYKRALQEILDDSSSSDVPIKSVARESQVRRELSFKRQRISSYLNYTTIFIVLIVTIVNMLIGSFGIRLKATPPQTNGANATTSVNR